MKTTLVKLIIAGILSLGGLGAAQIVTSNQAVSTNTTESGVTVTQETITLEKAKEIALQEVAGTVQRTEEDNDDYSIYILKDNEVYDVEVNKFTGQVDSVEKEQAVTSTITLDSAQQIALQEVDGTIQSSKEENDEYVIYIQKDNYLYEVDVNKSTGKVDSIEKELIQSTTDETTTDQATTTTTITLAIAKEIALKRVNGTVKTTSEDSDDYTIYVQKGNYIYEIEVNKKTGNIDDVDKERVKSTSTTTISTAKAKEIALTKVNGTVKSVDYDSEDNEYEVEVVKSNVKYEIKIDGATGKVLKVEMDD